MSDTKEEEQRKIEEAVAFARVANDVGWMRGTMEKQGQTLERIEQTLSILPQTYATKEEHKELEKKVDETRKLVWKASGAVAVIVIAVGIIFGAHGGIHIP